jgi:dihydrofolate reductase
MRSIIYHVATSIDGFIAGVGDTPAETIQSFPFTGPHVDDYNRQLQEYDTVLMGRRTYEFGFAFGLKPGQAPYPHMDNYVFSSGLPDPEESDPRFFLVRDRADQGNDGLDLVRELREKPGSDIYLCGGGAFATALLRAGLIDRIKLKVAPIILGGGVALFNGAQNQALELEECKTYGNGVLLLTYSVSKNL